jgi:hypothetical protein
MVVAKSRPRSLVAAKFKNPNEKLIKQTGPLWTGPEGEGWNGGVTQGMIASWLVCRERFRLKHVVGLQPAPDFNHRIEYGNLWHVCEEALSAGRDASGMVTALNACAAGLCKRFPLRREAVEHWWQVCLAQFPIYVDHWRNHPDNRKRTPLLQEQVFDVPYRLPSGRVVRLRGKWDAADRIGGGVWLQENKTKGDVDEELIRKQLTFDLQTMLYLVALRSWYGDDLPNFGPVLGVRYNVVRRPLSGGRHSIKRREPSKANPRGETAEEFYARLGQEIRDDPTFFFARFECAVDEGAIARFRKTCLDPILGQMCDWYDFVTGRDEFVPMPNVEVRESRFHFVMPYGVYSPLLDGGQTEYDHRLNTGSDVGLVRVGELFPELKEGDHARVR